MAAKQSAKMEAFRDLIAGMDAREVGEAWRLLRMKRREAEAVAGTRVAMQIAVGTKVSFMARKHRRLTGEVVKVNRTRAVVEVTRQGATPARWGVPFHMLSIHAPPEAAGAEA